ncbi:MAG: metallophosphoesterase [Stackebrandtia sp.]
MIAAGHYYLWRRLVRDTTVAGGRPRRLGTIAAVTLPVVTVLTFFTGRLELPFTVEQVLAWPGYLWLALFMYLVLATLVAELIRPLALILLRKRDSARLSAPARESARVPATVGGGGDAGDDAEPEARDDALVVDSFAGEQTRRRFLARSTALVVGTAAAATVGYGASAAFSPPALKEVHVPLTKLPRHAHGFRIAVVSDIHLGAISGKAHCQRIVDVVNSAQPDLIAIVGDLVDGTVEDLGPAAEPIAELSARHGAYFVTGNHEYYTDTQEWLDHIRELGVTPLENARAELPGFDLAGVNDVTADDIGVQGPDFEAALGDRDPARASVLMAHQPVQVDQAADYGVDLQLSGHTHGGQMWPFTYVVAATNPTVAGLERYGDTQLYVTRGAGAWGPPVRVGAESDVTVVTLKSRQV